MIDWDYEQSRCMSQGAARGAEPAWIYHGIVNWKGRERHEHECSCCGQFAFTNSEKSPWPHKCKPAASLPASEALTPEILTRAKRILKRGIHPTELVVLDVLRELCALVEHLSDEQEQLRLQKKEARSVELKTALLDPPVTPTEQK